MGARFPVHPIYPKGEISMVRQFGIFLLMAASARAELLEIDMSIFGMD